MALQVEEKQVGQQKVAVPGMAGVGALVPAVVQLAPVQTVVLHIIDDFQQGKGDQRLSQEKQRAKPAEGQAEAQQ